PQQRVLHVLLSPLFVEERDRPDKPSLGVVFVFGYCPPLPTKEPRSGNPSGSDEVEDRPFARTSSVAAASFGAVVGGTFSRITARNSFWKSPNVSSGDSESRRNSSSVISGSTMLAAIAATGNRSG